MNAVAFYDTKPYDREFFPNVLITLHQAFLTPEALSEIARVTAENLLCLANNKPFQSDSILVDFLGTRPVASNFGEILDPRSY